MAGRYVLAQLQELDEAVKQVLERWFFALAFAVFLGLTIGRAFFDK